jgi:hypothetical protein
MVQNIAHGTLAFDAAPPDEHSDPAARAAPWWLRAFRAIQRSQQLRADREIARVLRRHGIAYPQITTRPANR